jgi:glucose/arabinose dehydrogenase
MLYALGSLILFQGATLVLLGIGFGLRRRPAAELWFAVAGAIPVLLFVYFATPAGGWGIDFALGVAILPEKRFDPVYFHLTSSIAGVVSAALAVLVPRKLARSSLPSVAGWSLLVLTFEVLLARHVSLEQRLEWLTENAEGLRRYAGEVHHRVMPDPVPPIEDSVFRTEPIVAEGLEVPASLAFGSDGTLFIGEQRGRILSLARGATQPAEVIQVPDVRSVSEAGLLDLEVAKVGDTEYLYAYHTVASTKRNRVVRWTLEGAALSKLEVVVDDLPGHRQHNGGALALASDGALYIGTGTADYRSMSRLVDVPGGAQRSDNLYGKILRVTPDGAIPADNPSPGSMVVARGLRMVWRAREDPVSKRIFFTENGSADHDELNVLTPRANYGHPFVRGFSGSRRYEDPLLDMWKTIGVTGFEFYTGSAFPSRYTNDVFFCSYVTGLIYWLPLDDGAERLPAGPVRAIRPSTPDASCRLDIAMAPDGSLVYSSMSGVYRLLAEAGAGDVAQAEALPGVELYRLYCEPCHKVDGEGDVHYPPLNRSSWVTGDAATTARIVLFGLEGKMTVRDRLYSGKMLAFGQSLGDEEIARVVTHVRTSWDNTAGAVDRDLVAKVRKSGYGLTLD